MSTTSNSATPRLKYLPGAYQFVDDALRYTLQMAGRTPKQAADEEESHISGPELLEGIRGLALEQFGLMTLTVFHQWGVYRTDDFGRVVFELVERDAMRKTDRDQLSDFFDVYDFDEVFDKQYEMDVSHAFRR